MDMIHGGYDLFVAHKIDTIDDISDNGPTILIWVEI